MFRGKKRNARDEGGGGGNAVIGGRVFLQIFTIIYKCTMLIHYIQTLLLEDPC